MDIDSIEQLEHAVRLTWQLSTGWTASAKVVPRGETVEIAELRAYPSQDSEQDSWCGHPEHVPPGGLPMRRLVQGPNAVRLQDMADQLQRALGDLGAWETIDADYEQPNEVEEILEQVRRMSGAAGSESDPATRLAPLAWGYTQLLAGGWRNPNALLAQAYDRPRAWVTNELYRARWVYRLLTDTPDKGKAGGELTPKAEELIDKLNEAWATETAEEQEGDDA